MRLGERERRVGFGGQDMIEEMDDCMLLGCLL